MQAQAISPKAVWQVMTQKLRTIPFYVYTKARPDGIGNRNFSELSDAEKAQYLASTHPHEVVSAKDYTGIYRLLPDPMDYRSDSYLARLNIKITPNLVSKLLLEDTKQTYNIRDMRHCSYHGARLGNDGKPANGGSIVLCDDYQEYLNANDASQALFRPGANDAPFQNWLMPEAVCLTKSMAKLAMG